MTDAIETIELEDENITIEIFQDCDTENPREAFDNLSTFAFFHRNFKNESPLNPLNYRGWDDMRKYIEKNLDAICLPVYLYSHGGDTIATTPFSCPWDSGRLGYVYVEREKVRKEWGCKRISPKLQKQIENTLKGEIETFNQYINGEVYGYVIKQNGEEIDSCWGFYGLDYCKKEAESMIVVCV